MQNKIQNVCPLCGGSGRIRNNDPLSPHSGTFIHIMYGVPVVLACSECKGSGFVSTVKLKNNIMDRVPAPAIAFASGNNIVILPKEFIKEIKGSYSELDLTKSIVVSEIPLIRGPGEQAVVDGRKDFPLKSTGKNQLLPKWEDVDVLHVISSSKTAEEAKERLSDLYRDVPDMDEVRKIFDEFKAGESIQKVKNSGKHQFPVSGNGEKGYYNWNHPEVIRVLEIAQDALHARKMFLEVYDKKDIPFVNAINREMDKRGLLNKAKPEKTPKKDTSKKTPKKTHEYLEKQGRKPGFKELPMNESRTLVMWEGELTSVVREAGTVIEARAKIKEVYGFDLGYQNIYMRIKYMKDKGEW